ncbi:MAG: hypothetical protein MRJ65_01380 [Candidatus Brocadiaceae bacterium]|nr:hypothetical protein [Candidatus Brocadiaceae bacterium]
MKEDTQKSIVIVCFVVALTILICLKVSRHADAENNRVRNVIIMIADGMGVQEIALLNACYVEGHKYLGEKFFPKIDDFKEFYVHSEGLRRNILGRVVAKNQNVVYGSPYKCPCLHNCHRPTECDCVV